MPVGTTVSINVTIANGSGSAQKAEVRLGEGINWNIGGDVQPTDEVRVHHFQLQGGNAPNPMSGGDPQRTRRGPGSIDDSVRSDATTGTYTYDVTLVRAGREMAIDPEVQIKP